jgi:ankyrin repeat protein
LVGDYVKTLETGEQIRAALNRALLLRKPTAFTTTLIDNIEHLNSAGESPLVYALGHAKLGEMLLERGADINHPNRFGKTILFYAIEMHDKELLGLLLRRGADVARRLEL